MLAESSGIPMTEVVSDCAHPGPRCSARGPIQRLNMVHRGHSEHEHGPTIKDQRAPILNIWCPEVPNPLGRCSKILHVGERPSEVTLCRGDLRPEWVKVSMCPHEQSCCIVECGLIIPFSIRCST